MPSPSKGDIEPPDEITSEAAKGFLAGAFKYGSVSILAHLILILPHPFSFSQSAPPVSAQSQPQQQKASLLSRSRDHLRARLFYRPLEGFSQWLSPTARVYRGLTPQFKVFLQIAAMTLGGCMWAERRATEFIDYMRKVKRAERVRAEREREGWMVDR